MNKFLIVLISCLIVNTKAIAENKYSIQFPSQVVIACEKTHQQLNCNFKTLVENYIIGFEVDIEKSKNMQKNLATSSLVIGASALGTAMVATIAPILAIPFAFHFASGVAVLGDEERHLKGQEMAITEIKEVSQQSLKSSIVQVDFNGFPLLKVKTDSNGKININLEQNGVYGLSVVDNKNGLFARKEILIKGE